MEDSISVIINRIQTNQEKIYKLIKCEKFQEAIHLINEQIEFFEIAPRINKDPQITLYCDTFVKNLTLLRYVLKRDLNQMKINEKIESRLNILEDLTRTVNPKLTPFAESGLE